MTRLMEKLNFLNVHQKIIVVSEIKNGVIRIDFDKKLLIIQCDSIILSGKKEARRILKKYPKPTIETYE